MRYLLLGYVLFPLMVMLLIVLFFIGATLAPSHTLVALLSVATTVLVMDREVFRD